MMALGGTTSGYDEQLKYTIHSCSGFSANFLPQNVLINKPSDPTSRWLSGDNDSHQFVLLELDQPSIVKKVLLGKYTESHPCNLRKFRIYGGMDNKHLHLSLEDGMNNDDKPEVFELKFPNQQDPLPCKYIKIVPLQSWGITFNFSIWYVELTGTTEPAAVAQALDNFKSYYDKEAVRIVLKHLRDYDYEDVFEALKKKAKVTLEHPLLTQLHKLLVLDGEFESAEKLLLQAADDGYFDGYVTRQPVRPHWQQILQKSSGQAGGSTGPCCRGGHQMCIDSSSQTIFLHGGWDGSSDLADLWSYDIKNRAWACITEDTSLVNGPHASSCHKMCIDTTDQTLYVLGRFMDVATRAVVQLSGEVDNNFYKYSIKTNTWSLLSRDTASEGGPKLIYDHQMCFDERTRSLYVFGGQIIPTALIGGESDYSGLYVYQVIDKQWVCLRPDHTSPNYTHQPLPRKAHAMCIDAEHHCLYILGGQHNKKPLSDMVLYDYKNDLTSVIADGETSQIPVAGYSIKASLNSAKMELCVLDSLNKPENSEQRGSSNAVWTCDLSSNKWNSLVYSDTSPSHIPTPRFAHQFIYDHAQDVYYLFGGNPGGAPARIFPPTMRLDDFWRLKLVSLTKTELVRNFCYRIRKQKFSELTIEAPLDAVQYLQTKMSSLVDHNDSKESLEFRGLASWLFIRQDESADIATVQRTFRTERNKLYTELCSYFPYNMTQPTQNVTDLVAL